MGGSQRTGRNLTQTHGEHASSTQPRPGIETATVLLWGDSAEYCPTMSPWPESNQEYCQNKQWGCQRVNIKSEAFHMMKKAKLSMTRVQISESDWTNSLTQRPGPRQGPQFRAGKKKTPAVLEHKPSSCDFLDIFPDRHERLELNEIVVFVCSARWEWQNGNHTHFHFHCAPLSRPQRRLPSFYGPSIR